MSTEHSVKPDGNPSGIKQYFTEEILPDGSIRRSFTDHFGPDLDAYICNSYAIFYSYLDFYDDPEETERLLMAVSEGDFELAEDIHHHEIPISQIEDTKDLACIPMDFEESLGDEDEWTGDSYD
jgi:hypothetical protein